MLGFPTETADDSKCYVTHSVLGHVDPKQPPVKRKPFSAILKHDFIQKVEFILPEEIYNIINKEVSDTLPSYSRVILPLSALLEGEFFNEYIKKGNILMLSEGQLGLGNCYSLRDGLLTLHLDKESYERAGLVGQPEGVKGKRGTRPRWVVEINLRLPSMLHGKKGFDRIAYGFKNVLTTPVTWLFTNLETQVLNPDPIDVHFPVKKSVAVKTSRDIEVLMPSLLPPTDKEDDAYAADFDDYAVEMHEWLSLILLESPRVLAEDKVDPYLSRYVAPGNPSTSCKLAKLTWHGFLSNIWVRDVFVKILQAVPRDSWFAFFIHGFDEGPIGKSKSSVIMKLPDVQPTEYVLWEIEG